MCRRPTDRRRAVCCGEAWAAGEGCEQRAPRAWRSQRAAGRKGQAARHGGGSGGRCHLRLTREPWQRQRGGADACRPSHPAGHLEHAMRQQARPGRRLAGRGAWRGRSHTRTRR
eukprot:364592-Chlamydomonas_euryale.AAC.5